MKMNQMKKRIVKWKTNCAIDVLCENSHILLSFISDKKKIQKFGDTFYKIYSGNGYILFYWFNLFQNIFSNAKSNNQKNGVVSNVIMIMIGFLRLSSVGVWLGGFFFV